jgi:hypothetical protein
MQISATPLKWTIPFATNDSAKVELPATTADPTRFSLSLGSPPLTGQPPESGGVPPQLEDFNGAMNQIARFTWWAMGGGPLPFDATWSADPNVNGYAKGAMISTADGQGDWISVVDNNTANPDTVGTNWVPGYNYGTLALTGQTGGTVTLTPAQAVKRSLSIAGVLTSNLVIVVPPWLQEWTVTNTSTGAFTVTVKTAAGSGVIIPQNSSPTRVRGDGTNTTQLAENIAPGASATQPLQVQQKGVQRVTASGNFTVPVGVTTIWVSGCAGGGGGGGGSGNSGGQSLGVGGGGGGGGGAGQSIIRVPFTVTPGQVIAVTIGAAGAAGAAGGNTVIGALQTLTGGGAGATGGFVISNTIAGGGPGGLGGSGSPSGQNGFDGNLMGSGGDGAATPFGGGGPGGRAGTNGGVPGGAGGGFGAGGGGGGGAYGTTAGNGATGAAGTSGIVIFEW